MYYNSDIKVAKQVVRACYKGGVRVFEFTNRGDFAHEVFGELVKYAERECPELILGAGSVVDAATAALFILVLVCIGKQRSALTGFGYAVRTAPARLPAPVFLGLVILWGLAFLFVFCTFHPPGLALWQDPVTLGYGPLR